MLADELDADIKIAGSWTDKEVRYVQEAPEDYEDISKKLQYYLYIKAQKGLFLLPKHFLKLIL